MKQTPKATAYDLYFKTNLTQTQIAERAGVSARTLYDWMKQGNWKTLKANSRIMPAQIVDDIYNHIYHLNRKIKMREYEDRYPSREEAETLRKLVLAIPKVKVNVSKGESAQAMINFVSWLQTRNNDAAIFISDYIDDYLHAGRERGMEPYEFEFDAHQYNNAEDHTSHTHFTFEERVNEEKKQKDRHPEPISRPYNNTDTPQPENSNNTSLSLGEDRGEAPLTQENPQHVTPSPLVEKGSGDEVNKNQIGSKQEAGPQPPNPAKRPENQPPNLKKLPDPTSENKKSKIPAKAGRKTGSKEEEIDPNDPDYVQKVFDSWQKEINKNKRRKNRGL